ncbi:MAG TPA: branched chain amino acid aminotransferase [Spirochaetaceae bacterium]|nr:branched chain amino acid aminotransferase [Spirochaetaceae bacterium]
MQSKFIWMDGELVPYAQATIPFLSPALHYGAAVFEGIRCYDSPKGPAIFRAREHAERLLASARIFGFKALPWDADELVDAFRETVAANGFAECYIRPLLYLSGGGWNLNIDGGKPSLGIAAWEWGNYLGAEALQKGIRAGISSFTRHHPNATMTKAKISGNYANSILAKTESVRLGFDEAIMLDPQGYVAECTGENLFLVRKGRIYTTPGAAILEGITKDSLIKVAEDLGYAVSEAPLSRDQLYAADEVFVCGTAAEVIALSEIDHRVIGCGSTGPVCKAVQQAYHAAVRGAHPRSAAWLTPVAAQVPLAADREAELASAR